MSDDEFGDLLLDDDAFTHLDRVAENLQATQSDRPAKRQRLNSSPVFPDVIVNVDGDYSYAQAPEEDEIIDQRQTLPLARRRTKSPSPERVVHSAQLRDALIEIERLKARLSDAENASHRALSGELAKSGEVENLRRNMDRIARMQTERDKAHQDALARLHADLDEERRLRKTDGDRAQTELAFREQEMESTRRRRSRHIGQASQYTASKTPARGMHAGIPRRPLSSPSPKRMGFRHHHNSFVAAFTPQAAWPGTTSMPNKGKERAKEVDDDSNSVNGTAMEVDSWSQRGQEDRHDCEHISLLRQLLRILFSHRVARLDDDRVDYVVALPYLFHAQLPIDAAPILVSSYSKACDELVSTIGLIIEAKDEDEMLLIDQVGRCLVGMIDALMQIKQTRLLLAALSLLSTLSLFVRPVARALFSLSPDFRLDPENRLSGSMVLCACLETCLASDVEGSEEAVEHLVLMLECLLSDTAEEDLDGLDSMLRDTVTFALLLRETSPAQVVWRAIRLLTMLAYPKRLFRAILASPVAQISNGQEGGLPLVERLADLLGPTNGYQMHLAVLELVALLAHQHDDAVTLLTKSGSLLARLVALIHKDTNEIFDCPEMRFDGVQEELARLIVRATSALHVLQVLVCSTKASVDACSILHSHTGIYGAGVMFSVGIGRLAYLDAPEWLPSHLQKMLETASEAAQDILFKELGPEETDVLWDIWVGDEPLADSQATIAEEEEAIMID